MEFDLTLGTRGLKLQTLMAVLIVWASTRLLPIGMRQEK